MKRWLFFSVWNAAAWYGYAAWWIPDAGPYIRRLLEARDQVCANPAMTCEFNGLMRIPGLEYFAGAGLFVFAGIVLAGQLKLRLHDLKALRFQTTSLANHILGTHIRAGEADTRSTNDN